MRSPALTAKHRTSLAMRMRTRNWEHTNSYLVVGEGSTGGYEDGARS